MKVEDYEYKGYIIEIHTDEDPLNPRTEYDNVGTMCCEHGRYNLGDGSMGLLVDQLIDDYGNDVPSFDSGDFQSMIDYAEEKGYMILPLYLYDHSGITISTAPFSCPWDSGQVGIIFCSPKTKHEEGFKTQADLQKCLRGEVEEYDMYLTGQVYGFIVKDDEGEELDSCWGYFGDEYCKKDAESAVEWYVKENGEQLELGVTT